MSHPLTREEKHMLRLWLEQHFLPLNARTLKDNDELTKIELYFFYERNCNIMDVYKMYVMLHSHCNFTEISRYIRNICEGVPSPDEIPIHL